MPKMRKIGGEWRTVADRYRKVNGQWRKVVKSYRKIDGVWIQVFGKPYLRRFVENADKTSGEVKFDYDAENNSLTVSVNGVPEVGATVRAGVIIEDLPANSTIKIERRTNSSYEDLNRVVFTRNGVETGQLIGNNSRNFNVLENVNGSWSMFVEFKGGYGTTQMSFTLYSVELNGESIPLN